MKDQLIKLLHHLGISATKFADEIGVQRSSISHIISGRNKPSYDFIIKTVNKYPNINVEWFISGKGNMMKELPQKKVIKELDLFSNLEMNAYNTVNDNKANNSDQSENKESKVNQENNLAKEKEQITNVNAVDKIVFFYKNGSFKAYHPENE